MDGIIETPLLTCYIKKNKFTFIWFTDVSINPEKGDKSQETMISRWFMRGTDPIKSTWEYPNLIFVISYTLYNI